MNLVTFTLVFRLMLSNVLKCQFNIVVPLITRTKGERTVIRIFYHVVWKREILGKITDSAVWRQLNEPQTIIRMDSKKKRKAFSRRQWTATRVYAKENFDRHIRDNS
jgi:hypothetical protein